MFPFRSSAVLLARKQTLISGNGKILSASDWRFDPHCEPFTKLEYHPTLRLPQSTLKSMMTPSAQVFCNLPFTAENLKGTLIQDDAFVASFKIPETMKKVGHRVEDTTLILESMERMVTRLDTSVDGGDETNIDYLAEILLQICGFDHRYFRIKAMKAQQFDLFGRRCGVPDHTVILSPKGDLVLVCEDKKKVKKTEFVGKQGHLGQIMCELLQILSLNLKKTSGPVIRNVFAVRMINYHVTCFRIDPVEDTLKALVNNKTKTPPHFSENEKLTLLCSVKNPRKDYGLSLIDHTERTEACQLLTDVRKFILEDKQENNGL